MKISILCTDPGHPVAPRLRRWREEMETAGHEVTLCWDKKVLPGGDILFLVSCSQLVEAPRRAGYSASLVLHASDLPRGRGWSPHVWAVVNGANELILSMLDAEDAVDSGAIWFKTEVLLEGHELLAEINEKLFAAELCLMSRAVQEWGAVQPVPQTGGASSYLRKRTPDDSRLDPEKTIAEQFDLLRVVDNVRYPAFFEYRGRRYILKIEKA